MRVGLIITSGESKWAIFEGLSAIQHLLQETTGKVLTHFVLDAGKGFVSGVSSMLAGSGVASNDSDMSDIDEPGLSDTDGNSSGMDSDEPGDSTEEDKEEFDWSDSDPGLYRWARCTVHTIKNDLPSKRKKYPMKKDHFRQFRTRFKQLCTFPPDYFQTAWEALATRYRKRGNNTFVTKVEESIINPRRSGASMMGWAALGAPTCINALERSNRWFRKEIEEQLQFDKPMAKLPTSILVLANLLKSLWPEWVAADRKLMLNTYHQPSPDHQLATKEFLKELRAKPSLIINYNWQTGEKMCIVFKQISSSSAPLYPITKRVARQAARLWSKGPTSSISWKECDFMGTMTYTSIRYCFPCWSCGTTGISNLQRKN